MWISRMNIFPSEVPAQYQITPLDQRGYLIGGEIRTWQGATEEVLSPICLTIAGEVVQQRVGSYPAMTAEESLEALKAAVTAYDQGRGLWPTMSVADRIACVEKFTYAMKERRSEIVRLLMWEIGKSFHDSEKEFDRTVDYIVDTIEALKDLDRTSSRMVIEQGIIAQIRRAPLGVALCMGPFNYPLNETFTTLIPALIMGNTVVFKPPKLGVLLFEPLLEAFQKAFPAGVVNTVYGDGRTVISPLMTSGQIDVLAFIGSARVAHTLKGQHPRLNRLRAILGLDAKNAAIVLEDADLDLAVRECLLGSLSFNGQRCTAIKIIFVHSSVVTEFLKRFNTALEGLKVGMPWESGVTITPLPEPNKTSLLREYLEDALSKGAQVVNRGGGEVSATLFYPAVVYPVVSGMRLYHEEQFGPIVPVAVFDDIVTPIDYIVNSNYGQQVALFGTDPDRLADLIDPLVNQVCRVNLNSQCQRGPDIFPFTGRKDSAEATLSVTDALRAFSIRTLVAAREEEINKRVITRIVRERKSNFLSTDFIL